MTVRFEGKVDTVALKRVRQAIASTPSRVYPPLRREFERWGNEWKNRVEDRFTGTTGARSLHGRTGQLQKSLRSSVTGGSIGDLHLRCVSAGPIYSRIQEFGGEVRPKNAKFLSIPIVGNVLPSGVARYGSIALLASAFGESRIAFAKRPGKNTLVMLKEASARTAKGGSGTVLRKQHKGKAVPMFVLVDKVTLPGPLSPKPAPSRLGFFDEWAALSTSRRAGLARIGREIGRVS